MIRAGADNPKSPRCRTSTATGPALRSAPVTVTLPTLVSTVRTAPVADMIWLAGRHRLRA